MLIMMSGFLVVEREALAAIIDADSCSQSDVQTAIDSANIGDTVNVPSGECTWGDSGSYVSVNKAITLQGAGQNQTIINISTTAGSWVSGTIRISAAATVKSFTIQTSESGASGTAFSAGASGFRIADIDYIGRTTTINGYFIYAGHYGLVDNCNVTGGAGNNELIFARGPVDSWQTINSMGGADNLFIEDNTFNGSGYVCDINANGRAVVRYNTITGAMKIDAHGYITNGPSRSARHIEIYGNTWTTPASWFWYAMEIRGGGGRIFDNVMDYSTGNRLLGFHDYLCSYVENSCDVEDYPVKDQIGVGIDPIVAGSEPFYVWHNTRAGLNWEASVANDATNIIQPDRDYYDYNASFDGSSGIGLGTKAEMNSITPTFIGVGFWVTDEGEWNSENPEYDGRLYVWDGDSWEIHYTPYAYPHPLRVITRGDVDNSGAIKTTDALLTLRNSLGLSMTATAWQTSATTGDVDCNGISNSTDALLILRYSLGLEMGTTAWCE